MASSLAVLLLLALPLAAADGDAARPLETVDLQLRWTPQFQFAGYYAAVEQGYYREAGLDVRLHAGAPDRQPVARVLAGQAQYAEGNSEVLLARLQGKPVVALAAIFQHSPSVLLTLRKSGIETPHDLIGRRVMFMDSRSDPDFTTMLLNEGVTPDQLTVLPSSFDLNDLIVGRVDAFNSYLTNEPFHLRQLGIEYNVINPRNYRVDFYSDILFTTEDELRRHPQRVAAMRQATLRGWRYAMEHPEEVIELLIRRYKVDKSREHLRFEAEAMRPLILPELVEIGHMNPERWTHMADTFVRAGIVAPGYSLDGFMYDPRGGGRLPQWVVPVLAGAGVLLLLVTLVAWNFMRVNRRLAAAEASLLRANAELGDKLDEIRGLQARLEEQAIRDPLTGLYNRRYLDETLERELARARRDGYPLSLMMIDLDHFKTINDTYGHRAGDAVLRLLGELLQTQAREGDLPCRYGGEEFVLVAPRMSLESAELRANAWRLAFAAMRARHGDFEIAVTMSIGVAAFPEHAGSADALVAAADRALYDAKDAGRNRVVMAGPGGAAPEGRPLWPAGD